MPAIWYVTATLAGAQHSGSEQVSDNHKPSPNACLEGLALKELH
jgi:hypothetical protein